MPQALRSKRKENKHDRERRNSEKPYCMRQVGSQRWQSAKTKRER